MCVPEPARALLVVSMVLATMGAGCRSHDRVHTRDELAADFPPTIGPPLGLDRLGRGTADRLEAVVLLRQLGEVSVEDHQASARSAHVLMSVRFDEQRTVEVEMSVDACDALPSLLGERWGTSKRDLTTEVWTSAASSWTAGFETPKCVLRFTSKHVLPLRVGPPAVLAHVREGMTASEVAMVAPSIADGGSKDIPGVLDGMMAVVYEHDRVAYSAITVPPRITAILEERWGSALVGAEPDERFWVDPETGVRAAAFRTFGEITNISFRHYVPWRRWLGKGEGIDVLRSPVLGATPEELERAYGSALRNDRGWGDARPGDPIEYWIEVAPTEMTPPDRSRIDLFLDDAGRVKSFSFSLFYESRETRARMIAALESKWGARTKTTIGTQFQTASFTIHVNELGNGRLDVSVARR